MGKAQFFRKPNSLETDYTPRQFAILNGDIPIEEITNTELSILLKKTKAKGDEFNHDIANSLYLEKKIPNKDFPHLNVEESRAILQSQTVSA